MDRQQALRRMAYRAVSFALLFLLCGAGAAAEELPAGTAEPSPITVTAEWTWQSDWTETLWLAGIAPQTAPDSPYAALTMVYEKSLWLPGWKLQLHVRQPGGDEVIDLWKGSLVDQQRLTATLSYHPHAGVLALSVRSDDSGLEVAKGFALQLGDGPYAPVAGTTTGEAPRLDSLRVSAAYQPVADRIEVGEIDAGGIFLPVSAMSRGEKGVVRFTPAVSSPGEYVLSIMTGSAGDPNAEPGKGAGLEIEIARLAPGQGPATVPLPIDALPPGPATVRLDYLEDGAVTFTRTTRLLIGRADFHAYVSEFDRSANTVTGSLTMTTSDALAGVRVDLHAQVTPLIIDSATGAVREGAPFMEQTILSVPAEELVNAARRFAVVAPAEVKAWKIHLKVTTEPNILTSMADKDELFANFSALPDFPVAVTNQANLRIEVYDVNAADWSKPEALLWSWKPSTELGYSWAEVSLWRGPSDVKLRHSELWGGEWVLATAGDLATVAAYPSGIKKWAAFVGGNPHAIELLPDGNTAVAASTGGWVRVYTSSQDPSSHKYAEFALQGAHGVLWDPERRLLWAVGDYELVALRIEGTPADPVIEKVLAEQLPTPWGHDLYPVYGDKDRLWVTTGSRVYQYVKSTGEWKSDYLGVRLVDRVGVKSIGNQPSGQVVLTQPKAGSLYTWTTDSVQVFMPSSVQTVPQGAFYKARIWSADYQ